MLVGWSAASLGTDCPRTLGKVCPGTLTLKSTKSKDVEVTEGVTGVTTPGGTPQGSPGKGTGVLQGAVLQGAVLQDAVVLQGMVVLQGAVTMKGLWSLLCRSNVRPMTTPALSMVVAVTTLAVE